MGKAGLYIMGTIFSCLVAATSLGRAGSRMNVGVDSGIVDE
jgi:hypothetical protein